MATMQKFLVSMMYLENYGAHNGDGLASSGNAQWRLKAGMCYAIEASSHGNAMAYAMAKHGENGLAGKTFPESVVLLEQHIDKWATELDRARFHLSMVREQLRNADMVGLPQEKVDSLQCEEQSLEADIANCEGQLNMNERYPHWVDGGVAA